MKKNGEILADMLSGALAAGEIPYQANRRAIEAVDIQGDRNAAARELRTVLNGAGLFMQDLKELEDAARQFARKCAAAVL